MTRDEEWHKEDCSQALFEELGYKDGDIKLDNENRSISFNDTVWFIPGERYNYIRGIIEECFKQRYERIENGKK